MSDYRHPRAAVAGVSSGIGLDDGIEQAATQLGQSGASVRTDLIDELEVVSVNRLPDRAEASARRR